eukprot:TRINITY_DN6093_c0_g1_i1.p2 TRINITY_DN6093_c0_g1~~TRINITY_DN6093_c0_g1_i1.p2  ORF type:complete len:237 (+),score=47.90 TRINITY_DN6093_c0_g1_i1:1285-1995(+)
MAARLETLSNSEDLPLLLEVDNVQLWLGSETHGAGKLYISEADVAWWSAERGYGYAINYPDMMIHAVSRDLERFEQPCIYCYLDLIGEDGEPVQEEGISDQAEVRFVPEGDAQLDEIYTAMCTGQAANPEVAGDDGDGNDELYTDGPQPSGGWVFADGFDPSSVGLGGLVAANDDGEDVSIPLGGLNEVGQAHLERLAAGLVASAGDFVNGDHDDNDDMDEQEENGHEDGQFDDAD